MFDIDKHLDEIRNIDETPSVELVEKAMLIADESKQKANKKDIKKKATSSKAKPQIQHKRKNKKFTLISLTGLISAPLVAAAVLLFFVLNPVSSQIVASYTVDINPSIEIKVNRQNQIEDVVYKSPDVFDEVDIPHIKNMSVENAISMIVTESENKGFVKDDTYVLIGRFVKGKSPIITKNQIYSKLSPDIKDIINLLYIEVTDADKKSADKIDVSAGLYSLSTLGEDVEITSEKTLNEIIVQVEDSTNKSIEDLLNEAAGPTIYEAPEISLTVDADTAIIRWDYIDYARNNYDGIITYQLVCSDSQSGIIDNSVVLDEYRFDSWDKQPIDYSIFLDEKAHNKYYAVVAIYEDGTNVVDDDFVFIP